MTIITLPINAGATTTDHDLLNNLTYATAGHTGFEKSLTFANGVTRTVDTIKNDLITGKSGGQTIVGSTVTNEDLNLKSNAADLTTGSVNILDSLEASSTTVAAATIAGGLAVAKKIYGASAVVTTSYSVGANKVVGAQVAALGLNVKSDANKITDIIAALRAHGLLGPDA